MRRRMNALLDLSALVIAAALSSAAPVRAAPDAAEGEGIGDVLPPAGTQLTPLPPACVPFGTELRDRLAAAAEGLKRAEAEREAAVRDGKDAESVGGIEARIEELRRQVAEAQRQMERGAVPSRPVTPRPYPRAVSSTAP